MWVLAVLALLLIVGVVIYNGLVKLREQGDAAWADIDVQLKRRHDLVPNLVETVKGYTDHEGQVLERVVQARSEAVSARGPADRGRAEETLQGALRSLFVLAEDYPELRAAEGFRELQTNLSELEDHISKARRYYNAVVRDYNIRVGQVPSNLVAGAFGFEEREFFQLREGEEAVPEVSLHRPSPDRGSSDRES